MNNLLVAKSEIVKKENAPLKERFMHLLDSTDRDGIHGLMKDMGKAGFFELPASTHFHGAFEGGLLEHSLNVYHELLILNSRLGFKTEEGTNLAIVSLLHDVCKINCYVVSMRNVKKDNVWVKEPFYKWNDERLVYGHGEESVFILNKYINLTDEEMFTIRYHMGAYMEGDIRALNNVYRRYPLAMYLHFADVIASTKEG